MTTTGLTIWSVPLGPAHSHAHLFRLCGRLIFVGGCCSQLSGVSPAGPRFSCLPLLFGLVAAFLVCFPLVVQEPSWWAFSLSLWAVFH